MKLLLKLKNDDSRFYFDHILDPLGSERLEGLCWAFPSMRERALKQGTRFLIFDTTHETNRFGAYLCILAFENELGKFNYELSILQILR